MSLCGNIVIRGLQTTCHLVVRDLRTKMSPSRYTIVRNRAHTFSYKRVNTKVCITNFPPPQIWSLEYNFNSGHSFCSISNSSHIAFLNDSENWKVFNWFLQVWRPCLSDFHYSVKSQSYKELEKQNKQKIIKSAVVLLVYFNDLFYFYICKMCFK